MEDTKNIGEQIYFEHAGRIYQGIIKEAPDGQGRVRVEANGYYYRVPLTAVSKEKPEQENGTSNQTNNQNQTNMAKSKKQSTEKKAAAPMQAAEKKSVNASASIAPNEKQKEILALTAKKHVKLWLLVQTGLSRSEAASLGGTNAGHVGNVIKDYEKKPELKEAARDILKK